jgi:hypothetical protein
MKKSLIATMYALLTASIAAFALAGPAAAKPAPPPNPAAEGSPTVITPGFKAEAKKRGNKSAMMHKRTHRKQASGAK